MSSQYVRESIEAFIISEFPAEKIIDLSADYDQLSDTLAQAKIGARDNWIGLQFIGSEEIPVSLSATNTTGKYREIGIVYVHVVAPSQIAVAKKILPRAEAIRSAFRGMRIASTILIDSVSPPNFGEGVTLNFEKGYTSALVEIAYQRDLDL